MILAPASVFLLAAAARAEDPAEPAPSAPAGGWPSLPKTGTVQSVYDGDTMTLTTGDKIRLKWVNTPEMKPHEAWCDEARSLTEAFVLGKEVALLTGSGSSRDGYGRIVAGVRTAEGDLSEALLRAGYGHLFVIPPDDTDLSRLVAAQEEARRAGRGIWSEQNFQGAFHLTSFHANAPGDDTTNVNGEYMRIANVSPGAASLDGWRLVDIDGNSFRMPPVVVPVGQTAAVHSGTGANGPDASGQIEVYLGSLEPIWNNEHEIVQLYDPSGALRDQRESHGSGGK